MVAFTSQTERDIARAGDLTAGAPTGWATAASDAVVAVADELGDAALLDAADGDGLLLASDASGRLPAGRLPESIPVDNLPTGNDSGDLPLIGAGDKLPASVLSGVSLDNLTTAPTSASGDMISFTSSGLLTLTDFTNIQAIYVIAVGAGGFAQIGADFDDDDVNTIGLKADVQTALIPRFALNDIVETGNTISIRVGSVLNASDVVSKGNLPMSLMRSGRTGVDGLITALGGHTCRLNDRPSLSQLSAIYSTERRTGATISGVSAPSGTTTAFNYTATQTTEVAFSGYGAPNIGGVCVVYIIR